MKLSDYIVYVLEKEEVDTVFGYTGGSIADLVDSICKSPKMKYVQSYNEQASAFEANAYAQVTGKIGVAISSSGPGAINLINGIANAYFDSISCVFITGNVHSLGHKKSAKIRQNAFQETNIVEIVKSITKYAVCIKNEKDIKYELEKAIYISTEGRRGPVLIDIPYDILRKEINVSILLGYNKTFERTEKIDVSIIKDILKKSKKPLLLVGGGCQDSKKDIKRFLENIDIPIVSSMRGLDIISHEDKRYMGFIGSYGNQYANLAIYHCDTLLVLGSRLDERQMGYNPKDFAPNARIIQVDIDESELGRKTENFLSLRMSVSQFIDIIERENIVCSANKWIELLNDLKEKYTRCYYDNKNYLANSVIYRLSEIINNDAIVATDVGQNQIICAQSLNLHQENIFLSSCGLACMGYSLPASIGAFYAAPDRQIISINGDGGILMNLQELQTINREKLPIKIVVLNNQSLGLIKKLQDKLFDQRYYGSEIGYSEPQFEKIAMAFELKYKKIQDIEEVKLLANNLKDKEPILIEVFLPSIMSTVSEPGEKQYFDILPLDNTEVLEWEKRLEEL